MFSIMPEGNRNPEADETDPAKLAKFLEAELMMKRAAWQRSRGSLKNLRVLSFFFLFLIVIAAGLAFYLLFSPERVGELRAARDAHVSPTPAASASPSR
jgi:hypothetical protein